MLKIGDFAKFAQVSVRTLRYYAQLGLFKPAWIDRFTGYRYYALDQLPHLNRILALKELGFSLEEIGPVLRDDLPAAELRGMLKLKYSELEREIRNEQARLRRVAARIQQIEREGELPQYDIRIKSIPPQTVVGLRETVPDYGDLGHLFAELERHLQQHNISTSRAYPFLAVYYESAAQDQGVDVEAAARLQGKLASSGRFTVHSLPGVETMACVIHQGDYARMGEAYGALVAWIESNSYQVAGPNRDVYLRGPGQEPDADRHVTEVQVPVTRKPVSTFVTHFIEEKKMEPKIVTKPAFAVVGMEYRGKNENNELPQLWAAFNTRMTEIKHLTKGGYAYGVCGEPEENGSFRYVAGLEVDKVEDLPSGMTSWEIPKQKYAVFPCTLPTIGQAYEYAFQTWLPQSGYQRAESPDFELYDEEFEPGSDSSQLYIYIPIK